MNDIVFKFVQENIKEQFLKQLQDCFETYFNYPFNRDYYEDYFLTQLKKRKVREYKRDISLPWEQQPDYEGILEDFAKNFPQKVLYQAVAEKKGLEVILHLKYIAFSFSTNGRTLSFLDKKTDSGFTVLVWSHEVERIYWSYQKRSNALIDGETRINTLYDDILLEKEPIISGSFDIIDKTSDKNLGDTFIGESPLANLDLSEKAEAELEVLSAAEKLSFESAPPVSNSERLDESSTQKQASEDMAEPSRTTRNVIKNSWLDKLRSFIKNVSVADKSQSTELAVIEDGEYQSYDDYALDTIIVKANKLASLWEYHEDSMKYVGSNAVRFAEILGSDPIATSIEELNDLKQRLLAVIDQLPQKKKRFSKEIIYLVNPTQNRLFMEVNQLFDQIQYENKILNQLI
ncbi:MULTISPECIES: hypothetical protein [unclassified Enterococcus]|uniref:hypothetical protein n=1 Tax=unclassified Enterococcus TaxID=2608891 RepID=UPI0015533916|nr:MULTISPECIES: hypothetical protein [unclassified Enterococcus]MBS7577876.1 hypothetical protein [Enterococcus sp. MMGLQ5-2]MBS7585136.1 hypothetical protein [Enterococcus sp. MMGLQ5-1]NPD12992.1 hypothetical protein [Enterococcus sp. MMGLQ5-1]NPD37706.1 hypothetical protein [Enterococcus sp. MMGLQ5-2]